MANIRGVSIRENTHVRIPSSANQYLTILWLNSHIKMLGSFVWDRIAKIWCSNRSGHLSYGLGWHCLPWLEHFYVHGGFYSYLRQHKIAGEHVGFGLIRVSEETLPVRINTYWSVLGHEVINTCGWYIKHTRVITEVVMNDLLMLVAMIVASIGAAALVLVLSKAVIITLPGIVMQAAARNSVSSASRRQRSRNQNESGSCPFC